MADTRLKLVRGSDARQSPAAGPAVCGALGAVMLLAWIATVPWDVSALRRLPDAREQATTAVQLSMERGATDEQARRIAADLQERVRRAPLDSRTRSIYSAVLLALSRTLDQTDAAAFHAQLSAELAPVTTSVVRRSARVLMGTGDFDAALEWNRRLFEFAPADGAEMLSALAPGMTETETERFLPPTVEAWLAWSRELRRLGRTAESERWIDRSFDRWPRSRDTLRMAASQAFRLRNWDRLDEIFAKVPELPDEIPSSVPLIYRAHLRLEQGRREEADADLRRALALGPGSETVWLHAGDYYAKSGQIDPARSAWTRTLHLGGAAASPRRANTLSRLARLEQKHGQASRALRHWKEVLEIRPDDGEARKNLRELGAL